MTHYRLRQRAKDDIQSIWQRSLKNWGRAQARKYTESLRKTLAVIGDNPRLGREVEEYPGFFVLPYGAHLVFYVIADDGVPEIVRIPDGRQDRSTIAPGLYERW